MYHLVALCAFNGNIIKKGIFLSSEGLTVRPLLLEIFLGSDP